MVRIAAINYLNTVPFVYGLEASGLSKEVSMRLCSPAACAQMLLDGSADLGIVPAAVVPSLDSPHIISDYCIGADGKVASVLLCSDSPLSGIEEILLDTESRTSVLLLKYLCREKWKISPSFRRFDFSSETIDPSRTYLLIGDKALGNRDRFKYVLDLAEEWVSFKKLPFVFAVWAANTRLPQSFVEKFNQALKYGIDHIDEAVSKYNNQFPKEYACKYLKENISFKLDGIKRAGLAEYWRVALEKLTPLSRVS